MNSFGAVLLGFFVSAQLISVMQPIPFLGFAICLLGFPLALRIPFHNLFWCELGNLIFGFAVKFEIILFQFNYGLSYSSMHFTFLPDWLFAALLFLIMAGMIVLFSLGSAALMKVLSRFTPKKLRYVVNGI